MLALTLLAVATNVREQEPDGAVDRVTSELPYIANVTLSKGIFDWKANLDYCMHMGHDGP